MWNAELYLTSCTYLHALITAAFILKKRIFNVIWNRYKHERAHAHTKHTQGVGSSFVVSSCSGFPILYYLCSPSSVSAIFLLCAIRVLIGYDLWKNTMTSTENLFKTITRFCTIHHGIVFYLCQKNNISMFKWN